MTKRALIGPVSESGNEDTEPKVEEHMDQTNKTLWTIGEAEGYHIDEARS